MYELPWLLTLGGKRDGMDSSGRKSQYTVMQLNSKYIKHLFSGEDQASGQRWVWSRWRDLIRQMIKEMAGLTNGA